MGRGGVLYNYSFSLFAMKINPKNDKDNFPSIVIKLPDHIPGLLSLSILSMLGEGRRSRGLPWLELSDPMSLNESSSVSKSSFTHLWQILCWQGRINGWVNSSLHAGQISSLSIFLMVTLNWEKEIRIKGN